jgi:hypothetical protein
MDAFGEQSQLCIVSFLAAFARFLELSAGIGDG